MTGLEILDRLAESNTSSEEDDFIMESILRNLNFPNARVTLGIVYLEGRGTIEAPPAPVNTIAKMILKALNK